MTDELAILQAPLPETSPYPLPSSASLDRNPVAVYPATFSSKKSRRTMAAAQETLAALLSGGKATAGEIIPWGTLRYAHTAALRAALIARYRSGHRWNGPLGASVFLDENGREAVASCARGGWRPSAAGFWRSSSRSWCWA